MRGINFVIILGNLGADPEVHKFSNGNSVTNISVVTNEQWTDKRTGEKRENTESHRVALLNNLGEQAAQLLKKGSSVYIEGSVRTRKYQDANGQDIYATEVVADKMLAISGNANHSIAERDSERVEVSTKISDFVAPPFDTLEQPTKNDFVPPPFTTANEEPNIKVDTFNAPPF